MKKISIFLDRFIPEHIIENNPKFYDFMLGYMKYLESDLGPYDIVSRIALDENVGVSVGMYLEQYQAEYAPYLPKTTVADIETSFRQIRSFYKAKGTEDSFRWLFRTYYGHEIEFYYPKVDILRVSDGKWLNETTIAIEDQSFNHFPRTILDGIVGKKIVGKTSGATGDVVSIGFYNDTKYSNTTEPGLLVSGTTTPFVEGEGIFVVDYVMPVGVIFLIPSRTGVINQVPGTWLNEDGKLSSNKKIQDNHFYQEMSYQIRMRVSPDTFKVLSESAIHPAGRVLFSKIYSKLSEQSSVVFSPINTTSLSALKITMNLLFNITTLSYDVLGTYVVPSGVKFSTTNIYWTNAPTTFSGNRLWTPQPSPLKYNNQTTSANNKINMYNSTMIVR